MSNLIHDLNYDYNYNVFLAKAMLPNLANMADKSNVSRWLQKLDNCNKSIDEMRLRNDFVYFLVLNMQEGTLQIPFNNKPPGGSVLTFSHLLPRGDENVAAGGGGGGGGEDRPMLYARSPDGGAFLAAQPVPRAGAFAYLAVVCRPTTS